MPRSFATSVATAALMLAACAPGSASSKPAAHSGPPRLIVAISVDQLSADLFAQYRARFSQGLARLQQGAVFASGYQSHAATETCPGHATLLTGVRPARSGIIANYWFDPSSNRPGKGVYCAEDPADPASSARNPVVSAALLKVPTLGDRLKGADPASRNVAVSAKDRSVVMMGGHAIDAGYWWKGAGFATFAGRPLSPAVEAENRRAAALVARGQGGFTPPAWCADRDAPVQVGGRTVGQGRFALGRGKPGEFYASPRMDAATVSLALGLVDEQALGRDAAPDVLSVSLSATDIIGHSFGSEGMEMCIQLAELDKTIGRLLAGLDSRGIDYLVVLTADHGGMDAPERLRDQALPRAVRVDDALTPGQVTKALAERTGLNAGGEPLLYADGAMGDFYLNRRLSAAERARAIPALVSILKAHPQVAAVFTGRELADTPLPTGSPQDWSLKERARASYDPERSGDAVVLLERAVTPIPLGSAVGVIATHGSPWDYDRRVPILFWRRGMAGFEQPAPVEAVDIAPTLAAILGLNGAEGAYDGRCLDLDGTAANTCGSER